MVPVARHQFWQSLPFRRHEVGGEQEHEEKQNVVAGEAVIGYTHS